jgi:hypothetical protein
MARSSLQCVLPAATLLFIGVLGAQTAPPAAPSKPAPKHDLTGVWMARNPATMREFAGATFTKEEPEMTPWALAKYKEAKSSNGGKYTLDTTNDPVVTKCDPPGVPRVYFHPYPFEFVSTPAYVLMLYEYDHMVRRIYTDGRPLPEDPDLSWMGSSVGHWDGDTTFVVDTVGFNDKTWLDPMGLPHSDAMHVTERLRRVDHDTLVDEYTIDDPKAYTNPWTAQRTFKLKPDWQIQEYVCAENNKSK